MTRRDLERRRRLRRLEATARFATELLKATTPDGVGAVLVELGLDQVGASRGSLVLLGDDASVPDLCPDETHLVTSVVTVGGPVFIREIRLVAPELEEASAQAVAALPVKAGTVVTAVVLLWFDVPQGFDAEQRLAIEAVAQRVEQALERAWLLDSEQRARAEAEQAVRRLDRQRRRADRLRAVAVELAISSSVDDVVQVMVGSAADALEASAGVVVLVDAGDSGALRVIGSLDAGASPNGSERVSRPEEYGQADLVALFAECLTMRKTCVVEATEAPERWLIGPLASRGAVIAAWALALGPDRSGEDDDIVLFEALAAQCGPALGRAQRFDVERDNARALQESLLPRRVESVPGMTIATVYRPAQRANAVGGDWYDVIPLASGEMVIVVGDAVGHGIEAAAVMGQLRAAAHATAELLEPAALLERLDAFVPSAPGAWMATVACLRVDPRRGTMTYSLAGHPPPLLRERPGHSRFLQDALGPPLGLGERRPQATDTLPPGGFLLAYTDGLVEQRNVLMDARLDDLAKVLASGPPEVEAMLAEVERTLLPSGNADDVAVVCCRRNVLP